MVFCQKETENLSLYNHMYSHTFFLKSHVIQWTSQNTSHPDHVCDNHLIASHICEMDKRTQERHLRWKRRAQAHS